jgi:uncharacterized protein YgbK (DUF1537 family)
MHNEKFPALPFSTLQELPPVWPEDLLPIIRRELAASKSKVIILDDDPTGTQTIRNVPVLTSWSVEVLTVELRGPHPAFFVLTNSRSLTEEAARLLACELGNNIRSAMSLAGVEASVISRSDSTLRGHFPAEVDELALALERNHLPRLVIPFFEEGGRYTLGDVHYVREKDVLLPAASTTFARDAAFGYHNSHLKKWVEEKSGGRIAAGEVAAITLDDLRRGGPERVAELLLALPDGSTCIVNGADYRDMEVLSVALLEAARQGRDFLFRSASCFVRSRLGQDGGGLLAGHEVQTTTPVGGLFVVGSHIEKSTRQLAALLATGRVAPLELPVDELLDHSTRQSTIDRLSAQASELLAAGRDCAIFTSRRLYKGTGGSDSLRIAGIVSSCLIATVTAVKVTPRYLVAKGGITSSDLATEGLKVARAMVIGQILPGVPVWRLGVESRCPGMAYIVFPGNVGDEDALVKLQAVLDQR